MLAFLPAPILFIINFIGLSIITLLVACPMLLMALFKWIPSKAVSNMINAVNQTGFKVWVANNAFLMRLTNKIDWDIQGLENVQPVKGSCIIISNHLSWTDIVMLGHVYRGKIPITKFFLKQSLIFIPVVGLVCYAIGMPFLKRYTREQLLRNPKLKHKDLDTTRKACMSLVDQPSSLINFVEGTRYTPEKAKAQKSTYRNLMPPKAASLAVALGLIGKDIDCLFNTTLLYPHTEGNVFFALLCGRLKKVIARVEKIEHRDEMVGDYLGDKQFKHKFTQNLRQIWQQKDEQLTQIKLKEGLIKQEDLVAAIENNTDEQTANLQALQSELNSKSKEATEAKQTDAQHTDAKQTDDQQIDAKQTDTQQTDDVESLSKEYVAPNAEPESLNKEAEIQK